MLKNNIRSYCRSGIANKRHKSSSVDKDEDTGYMKRRLAQLAEESRPFKDDPKAGRMYFEDEDGDIQSLIKKITDPSNETEVFNYKHQREIAIATKIPQYAGSQTKDIALAKPWTGQEEMVDAANRMLNDAYKPLSPGLALPAKKSKISVSSRLANAREKSLDYKINPKEEKGPTFKEIYAERFAGISSMTNDFSAIGSLATQRIEDSIARGEFKNLPGRGKPSEIDYNISSPNIDHTEYYLNNMLKRQGAMPPWIDRQGSAHRQIQEFRTNLEQSWLTHIVHHLSEHKSDQKSIQLNPIHHFVTRTWKEKHKGYHQASIENLNSVIRSYNLQAPAAARRGYLTLEGETGEFAIIIKSAVSRIDVELGRFLNSQKINIEPIPTSSVNVSVKDLFKKQQYLDVPPPFEIPEKGLIKNLFKDLFKVQKIE